MERIRVDVASLLERVVPGSRGRRITPHGNGHSGFTYSVATSEGTLILRLSPPGVRIAGPADVGRQGRIMAALHAGGLPVPHVLAWSSAPEIDGRSFALM